VTIQWTSPEDCNRGTDFCLPMPVSGLQMKTPGRLLSGGERASCAWKTEKLCTKEIAMKIASKMTGLAVALSTSALATVLVLKVPWVRADAPVSLPRFVPTPEQLREGYEQSQRSNRRPRPQVYKGQIKPNWFHDNRRFWYRNDLRGGDREFIVVDAERGVRQRAFDHDRLAAALSQAAGKKYRANQVPFDSITFVQDDKAIHFTVDQTTWQCDLTTYACVRK
jgi:hypothetical protein